MAPTLILSHGMESGPDATKVTALAAVGSRRGMQALRPDYRGQPDWRTRHAQLAALVAVQAEPPILVGSSIGAYISGLVSTELPVAGLFLLAPPISAPPELPPLAAAAPHLWIVHGWDDELIAPAQVVAFAQGLKAQLLLVAADHRLEGCVALLERQFELFLDVVLA